MAEGSPSTKPAPIPFSPIASDNDGNDKMIAPVTTHCNSVFLAEFVIGLVLFLENGMMVLYGSSMGRVNGILLFFAD